MDGLVEYSIPIKGLRDGAHEFRFRIDGSFFRNFEASPVAEGNIEVDLTFEKRPGLYVLEFDFGGTVRTECDRCLAAIDLPVSGQERLLVKFSEENEVEEADVIYISPEAKQLNVAKYIYEFVILSMPIIKVYDCEKEEVRPCNEEMLRYLDGAADQGEVEEKKDEGNPVWDELKKSLGDN